MTGKWTTSHGRRVALGGWMRRLMGRFGGVGWGVKVRGKGRRCQEKLQVWTVFPRQDVSDTKKSELDSGAFRSPPPHSLSAAPSVTGGVMWRCLDFRRDVEQQPVEVQPRWRRRQRRFRFTLSPWLVKAGWASAAGVETPACRLARCRPAGRQVRRRGGGGGSPPAGSHGVEWS